MNFTSKIRNAKSGVVLLISVLILSSALAIALGIFNVFFGQFILSEGVRESYEGLYSAVIAQSCAQFYDNYPPHTDARTLPSLFQDPSWDHTSPPPNNQRFIVCGGQAVTVTRISQTEFEFDFMADDSLRANRCVESVIITKIDAGNPFEIDTTIVARGTNGYELASDTCVEQNGKIERAMQINYPHAI